MRLPSGEVFKMNSADVVRVKDNDDEGVDDILKLRDFSEMSLIHTLRVRYFRGAIYTFVGPILVSINPYKHIKGIYSEKTMVSYHSSDKATRHSCTGSRHQEKLEINQSLYLENPVLEKLNQLK